MAAGNREADVSLLLDANARVDVYKRQGLGIGLLTLAGHLHRGFPRNHPGYMGRLSYAQDLSGVTAACMMVKKSVFEEVGGFDKKLAVAFNDVDLCLKIRQAGYLICFTPFAELYHYESKSRGTVSYTHLDVYKRQVLLCTIPAKAHFSFSKGVLEL